ncbi:MAG TPA: crotonase/enoyl-CoA hydratase family protein [Candidatus Binatia bacterium]|jgi:enoyl-CoA hydratase|nr:crotonase/enoyl-CoA hydratase family protein [Candidatus Binatia bacterium]
MSDTIRYAVHGHVGEITLDDGKVNAMSLPFFEGLNAALDRAEAEKPLAVVVTGRDGVFSAGLNLKVLPTLPPDELRRTMIAFGRTMLRVFTFPIPTVAAVSGHAVAGGAILMLACDLRHAADGPFRIHLNEVAIGLALPSWAIAVAHSAIPSRWHTEAILHARLYGPADALERGIVDAVVPPERLLESARAAAAALAPLDQTAYAISKQRHRAMEVAFVSDLLEKEIAALPSRAAIR